VSVTELSTWSGDEFVMGATVELSATPANVELDKLKISSKKHSNLDEETTRQPNHGQ
jgi:hypothetical protein